MWRGRNTCVDHVFLIAAQFQRKIAVLSRDGNGTLRLVVGGATLKLSDVFTDIADVTLR